MADYDDNAVFMPGKGAVLIGAVGAEPPKIEAVDQWVSDGAIGPLGEYQPLGHTSLDDLPKLDSDIDGGEKKGSWENDSLRLTKITSTDTVTVTAIQWSETPLTHRFGPGKIVTADGRYEAPAVYTSTEVSLLVILIDSKGSLVLHFPKVALSPDDGIELDPEEFAGMPIKYTVLNAPGKPKFSVTAASLKGKKAGTGGAAA